jgi:hypothetical protein
LWDCVIVFHFPQLFQWIEDEELDSARDRGAIHQRNSNAAKFSIIKTQTSLSGKKISIFQKAARDGERSVAWPGSRAKRCA